MAQKEKPGFVLYHDDMANLEPLTDEECGKLIRAAAKYSQTGEIEQFDGVLAFALHMLIRKIDRDDQKYAETCRKRGKKKEPTIKEDSSLTNDEIDVFSNDEISTDNTTYDDICEHMITYDDIIADKNAKYKYKDKYKPPLKGYKKNNISHNARAREDSEALEATLDALLDAGNDEVDIIASLSRLADRYTAQNVKRAALKSIRDGTPTIKDIRGILFSWEQNDMHRDQVIRIQERQKQEE